MCYGAQQLWSTRSEHQKADEALRESGDRLRSGASVVGGCFTDRRLSIRYNGIELAYRTFDKIQQVDQGAIADNKRLGEVLAMIRDQQLSREPQHRSQRAPRRRDQRDARLFKVG
jgi:hypothetical protein